MLYVHTRTGLSAGDVNIGHGSPASLCGGGWLGGFDSLLLDTGAVSGGGLGSATVVSVCFPLCLVTDGRRKLSLTNVSPSNSLVIAMRGGWVDSVLLRVIEETGLDTLT